MSVFKRLTGTVCALALCLQAALPAVAASAKAGVHTKSGVAVVSLDPDNEYLEEYTEGIDINDDPSYIKFVKNQNKLGAVDFSSLVTHQERFSSFNKLYGIDVSVFNGDIDFEKVKKEGYSFVIVRAGARGYGSAGTLIEDNRFEEHVDNAHKAGLLVGAYFYTQAVNKAEVKQEAELTLKKIGSRKLEMPVYFDIEPVYDWNGDPGRLCAAKLSKNQKAELCSYYCDLIKQGGYDSGITSCKSWFEWEIDMSKLEKKYDIWLAHYTTNTNYSSDYNMWQFNSTRKVDGVYSTCTDQDVRYIDLVMPTGDHNFRISAGVSNIVLKWDATANTMGYIIYRKDEAGNVKQIATTKELTYTLPRKGNEGEYYVRSYNIKDGQYYYSSASASIRVKPLKVTNIRTTEVKSTSFSVRWSTVNGAAGYCIYLDGNYHGTTGSAEYTFNNLAPLSKHTIKVSAYFNADTSKVYTKDSILGGYSDAFTVTTEKPDDADVAVKNITASAVSQTSVTIGWNAVSGASGYCLYFDGKYSGYCFNPSYTFTGLQPATKHAVKITAYFNPGADKNYGADSVIGGYSDAFYVTTLSDGKTEPDPKPQPTDVKTTSLAGKNRYSTAVLVSQSAFPSGADTVIIASGESYADALVSAPLANAYKAPILLTSKDIITETTLAEIKRLGAKNAYLIGGEGVISKTVDSVLQARGLNTFRVHSSLADNRYGTSVYVAANLDISRGNGPTEVFIAYALNYADTLAVGSVAAARNAPILYMDKSGTLDGATKYYLEQKKGSIKNVYIIGGTGVIGAEAETTLAPYGTVKRIAGANRYDTCLEVNKFFAGTLTGKSVCATTGQNFPDALAGGVLAAKNKSPIVIADMVLSANQKAYLSGKGFTQLYTFGGAGIGVADLRAAIKGS